MSLNMQEISGSPQVQSELDIVVSKLNHLVSQNDQKRRAMRRAHLI
jgi:hypothetical protein